MTAGLVEVQDDDRDVAVKTDRAYGQQGIGRRYDPVLSARAACKRSITLVNKRTGAVSRHERDW